MKHDSSALSAHPFGEQSLVVARKPPGGVDLDSQPAPGGRAIMGENDGGGPHDANSSELFSWQPTSAAGAPLWMKMVAARADLSEPWQRAIVLRLT